MDFESLTRARLLYEPTADEAVRNAIQEARNNYAMQRLLGNSQAAYDIKDGLQRELRQADLELRSELAAIFARRKSVISALSRLEEPIIWPLWPESSGSEHEEATNDLMKSHRRLYRNKLESLKNRKYVLCHRPLITG